MSSILAGITRPGGERVAPENPYVHGTGAFMNRVRMELVGPDGKRKQLTPWAYNKAVTFGLDRLAAMIGSGAGVNASTWISCCKIGTGTTAVGYSDDSLINSTASVAITTAASMTNTYMTPRTLEYRCTFNSGNPAGAASIQEVGLFCNSTADSGMAARSVLTGASSVNKGASDVINLSYDLILVSA